MKKVLLALVVVLILIIQIPIVDASSKVPVYMISKEGCPACERALTYFNELNKEHPDMFELIELRVFDSKWNFNSEELEKMFKALYDYVGYDSAKAETPTIIIGDYHETGLNKEEVYKAITTYDKDDDEVISIAKELNIDIEKIRYHDNSGENLLIIFGIVIVVVAGFIGIISINKN
jgi:thiol-disulfide isomerase/thioredoxin